MVGYGEQDYNDAFLIFITAVTKKHKIDYNNHKIFGIGGWIWQARL